MTLPKRIALGVACLAVILMVAAPTQAAPLVINVGTLNLWENTPNQTVEFVVSGGDQVQQMEFNIQIGDGGAELGGVDTKPVITAVELLNGTIFQAGTLPLVDAPVTSPLAQQHSITILGTVAASGVIAKVTFDTTGVFAGAEIPLKLKNVGNPDIGFFDTKMWGQGDVEIQTNIGDGSLRIMAIPEPSVVVLLLVGCFAALVWRRRAH